MTSAGDTPSQPSTAKGQRRAVVVVNELAPQARALNWVESCAKGLGAGVEVTEVRCPGFNEVQQAAAQAAEAGVWLVISIGGDGTLNHITNGIGTRPTLICPLPGGTANEVANHLSINSNIASAVAALGQYSLIAIDAVRVNGRRFLNFGLGGFAADLCLGYNRLRVNNSFWRSVLRSLGPGGYSLYGVWALLAHADAMGGPMEISYRDLKDGSLKVLKEDIMQIGAYGPADQMNGKMIISRCGSMADGKFEIIILRRCSRWKALRIFANTADGTHLDAPEIIFAQTNWLQAKVPSSVEICLDGEPFEKSDTYTFEMEPGAVRMFAPKEARP